MIRHTERPRIALDLLIAALTVSTAITLASAQSQPQPRGAVGGDGSEQLLPPGSQEMLGIVMHELQELRGLEFKNTAIPLKRVPPERMRQRIEEDIDKLYPPSRRDNLVEGLARFGLLDRGDELATSAVTVRLAQTAMVYNPRSDRLLIVMDDIPPAYLRQNAVFRLASALQDQHFNTGELDRALEQAHSDLPRPDDRVLAGRFLLEGEPSYIQFLRGISRAGATLPMDPVEEDETLKTQATIAGKQIVMMAQPTIKHYATQIENGEDDPILRAMLDMADAPSYVIDPIYAAQNSGRYFISFLRRNGGWEDVARAHANPPVSTEQVLHPEKLFYEPDRPTPINLPVFSVLHNAKWTHVDSAIHGEYYLFLLIGRWTERFTGLIASHGWDGDIYQAWRSPSGAIAILTATTWDTPKDAREFYEGYLRVLGRKYVDQKPDPDATADRYSYACGEPGLEHGWLILRGREVFILEGFPKQLGSAVLEQLEAMEIDYVE